MPRRQSADQPVAVAQNSPTPTTRISTASLRALAGLLGGLGGLSGLLATSLAAGFGEIGARSAGLAACALGLLAARGLGGGRDRLAGVPFLEALLGLAIALGEYALIPGACFLLAAVPASARGWQR